MKHLKIISLFFVFFGIFPLTSCSNSETKDLREDNVTVSDNENLVIESKDATNYKVLSNSGKTLSISNVEYYIKQGDEFIKNGNFDQAKNSYLDARKLAKQLASFYSDLNSSFKGIDARIPNEMQRKGKETLQIFRDRSNLMQTITRASLSDGIISMICRANEPIRMTFVRG